MLAKRCSEKMLRTRNFEYVDNIIFLRKTFMACRHYYLSAFIGLLVNVLGLHFSTASERSFGGAPRTSGCPTEGSAVSGGAPGRAAIRGCGSAGWAGRPPEPRSAVPAGARGRRVRSRASGRRGPSPRRPRAPRGPTQVTRTTT